MDSPLSMESPSPMTTLQEFSQALKTVQSGSSLSLKSYMLNASRVVEKHELLRPNKLVHLREDESKEIVVIGPTRGHAVDLAKLLESKTLAVSPNKPELWPSFVLLGDYIDGGQQSMDTLILVLLLFLCNPQHTVLLKGRHELFFPIDPEQTGPFVGRFDEEVRLACLKEAAQMTLEAGEEWSGSDKDVLMRELQAMKEVERQCAQLFECLPIMCIVNDNYCCVCGGLGPGIEKMTLDELNETLTQNPTLTEGGAVNQLNQSGTTSSTGSALQVSMSAAAASSVDGSSAMKVIVGDPMDDDDDNKGNDAYYIDNDERGVGYTYSFNATCAFLEKNDLRCIIRGNGYTTFRYANSSINDCGRPWHYQHSPYDPGYRLYRKYPKSGMPSVISIFSAPKFCGTNHNIASYVSLSNDTFAIRQYEASKSRQVQLPGQSGNAFAWSFLLMSLHLNSALTNMLYAPTSSDSTDNDRAFTKEEKEQDLDGKLARYRQLCKLMSKKPGGLNMLARQGLAQDL